MIFHSKVPKERKAALFTLQVSLCTLSLSLPSILASYLKCVCMCSVTCTIMKKDKELLQLQSHHHLKSVTMTVHSNFIWLDLFSIFGNALSHSFLLTDDSIGRLLLKVLLGWELEEDPLRPFYAAVILSSIIRGNRPVKDLLLRLPLEVVKDQSIFFVISSFIQLISLSKKKLILFDGWDLVSL